MSKFSFSRRSKRNLLGIDPALSRVMYKAIDLGVMDFTVICGLRTQAEQDRLYAQGRTEPGPVVTWTRDSKHITGHAVDIVPYPLDWEDHHAFYELAGLIKAAAAVEGVEIKWGGDWRNKDLPHFELVAGN
jgi:peptidoglycan L-alanyl-D-glutamate endopeptidase CwlK